MQNLQRSSTRSENESLCCPRHHHKKSAKGVAARTSHKSGDHIMHALRLHDRPEPLPRLLVVGLHEAEAFRRRHWVSFRPPERHDTSASDHLETTLLVGRSHISSI